MPQALDTAEKNNLASPLLEDENTAVPVPDYSQDEVVYLGKLQSRLERARRIRDTHHDELDGMTFVQSWDMEERAANTFIAPKLNREDTTYQSGTIRQKLFALLAHLQNLDLSGDISAYDENQLEVSALGAAMEDIVMKTEDLDNDSEKKLMRQYELLKHGYVFVEEIWEETWTMGKKIIEKFTGSITSAKWKKKLKLLYARPVRNILSGLNVYLGDITEYDFTKQPYIFTVKFRSYADAEATYGVKNEDGTNKWERWQYVTKTRKNWAPTTNPSIPFNTWRLTEVQDEQVEEIHYQDKYSNEYGLLLNGVSMLPIGYPLPWGYEDYNVVQQNLEPVHPYWAYGKSLVSRLRVQVAVLDEMLRMAVLKTQKSFVPPYLNMSGKVVSSRVFMPGKITAGLVPGDLMPVHAKEVEGVTQSELNMIAELQRNIDAQSVSPNFTGQQQKGEVTATEVLELQRQAKLTLGTIIFSMSSMEWKLNWLRLFNILANWFNPIDTKADESRKQLKNVYRIVNVPRQIAGHGTGRRVVVPTDDKYSAQDIYNEEERLSKESGVETRITVINPEEIKEAKYIWQIVITPRERTTSDLAKVLFRGMLADIQAFGQDVNTPYLEEKFANVWQEEYTKLFKQNVPPPPTMPAQGGEGGNPTPTASAGVKIPGVGTPVSAIQGQFNNAIKTAPNG